MASYQDWVRLDLGRYSFSVAFYEDSHWGITPLGSAPNSRWRVDFWRFGVRFERY